MGAPGRFADAAGRRESLIVIGVSAVVLAAATIAASAELTSAEVTVFRSINGLPEGLYRVVWPFMQYGTFITIPIAAIPIHNDEFDLNFNSQNYEFVV